MFYTCFLRVFRVYYGFSNLYCLTALLMVLRESPVSSITCLYGSPAKIRLTACCFCAAGIGGLPSRYPVFVRAYALPASVRSMIRSRSNSAKASSTLASNRPVGVLSIRPMFKTWTFIPCSSNHLTPFCCRPGQPI